MSPTTGPPEKWTFDAKCDHCGVSIPLTVLGGSFRKEGDNIAYVVLLERMEIDAHLLTHEDLGGSS